MRQGGGWRRKETQRERESVVEEGATGRETANSFLGQRVPFTSFVVLESRWK